jgi:hypothetical protein
VKLQWAGEGGRGEGERWRRSRERYETGRSAAELTEWECGGGHGGAERAALAVVRGVVGEGDIREWEIVTICSESRRASRTL